VVSHVYVCDGTWAFDHDGWTLEDELLTVTRAATAGQTPGTLVERLALPGDLTAFCARHNSRLPSQYAFDPWPRALAYIARFEPPDLRRRTGREVLYWRTPSDSSRPRLSLVTGQSSP
jgi:hypothetical protein